MFSLHIPVADALSGLCSHAHPLRAVRYIYVCVCAYRPYYSSYVNVYVNAQKLLTQKKKQVTRSAEAAGVADGLDAFLSVLEFPRDTEFPVLVRFTR